MKHLEDFNVIVEQKVAWGEMDALSHVNNAVYFRYFETARIEYFDQIEIFKMFDLRELKLMFLDPTDLIINNINKLKLSFDCKLENVSISF